MKLSLNTKNETKGDWSNEEVRELILLWKEELFYNSRHEKYYNKDEKQKSWKQISSRLISCGLIKIKVAQISENITSLCSYNGIEKRKEKASKASSARTLEVCVSSWRFINDLDLLNDNLIPTKIYSDIVLETEEAFSSRENGGSIRVKSERLLKSNALERTRRNKNLASQRILQDKKSLNAMKIKEIAKSPEQIFGDLMGNY